MISVTTSCSKRNKTNLEKYVADLLLNKSIKMDQTDVVDKALDRFWEQGGFPYEKEEIKEVKEVIAEEAKEEVVVAEKEITKEKEIEEVETNAKK